MFRRLSVVAGAAALVGVLALPALAATSAVPHHTYHFAQNNVTEIVADVYGQNGTWALNNYNDQLGNNNLVSVWDDLGLKRTFFQGVNIGTVPSGTFAGDSIVAFKSVEDDAYISDWDNVNPAPNGFKGRMDYNYLGVASTPSAQWVAVPQADGNYALVNYSTLGSSPLALTVANNGVQAVTGSPRWSETALMPYTGAMSQQFSFKLPSARPVLVVDQAQGVYDPNHVTTSDSNDSEQIFTSSANFNTSTTVLYTFRVENTGNADVSNVAASASVAAEVTYKTPANVTQTATETVSLPLSCPNPVLAAHAGETCEIVYTASDFAALAQALAGNTFVSGQAVETPTVSAMSGAAVVTAVKYNPATLTLQYTA